MMTCRCLGAFAMKFFQVAVYLSLCFSRMPPHHIDPCAGIATHTRFTFVATPNAGTFNVKKGGSDDGS